MEMVKVKTSELEGKALDWSVAYHLNGEDIFFKAFGAKMLGCSITKEVIDGNIRPSADWGQAGLIIEKYNVWPCKYSDSCADVVSGKEYFVTTELLLDGVDSMSIGDLMEGPTALVAAMRQVVWIKSGEFVDVPVELLEGE